MSNESDAPLVGKSAPDGTDGDGQVKRVYALGRFGKWIGRLLGGAGKRTGARDPDPGS